MLQHSQEWSHLRSGPGAELGVTEVAEVVEVVDVAESLEVDVSAGVCFSDKDDAITLIGSPLPSPSSSSSDKGAKVHAAPADVVVVVEARRLQPVYLTERVVLQLLEAAEEEEILVHDTQ